MKTNQVRQFVARMSEEIRDFHQENSCGTQKLCSQPLEIPNRVIQVLQNMRERDQFESIKMIEVHLLNRRINLEAFVPAPKHMLGCWLHTDGPHLWIGPPDMKKKFARRASEVKMGVDLTHF